MNHTTPQLFSNLSKERSLYKKKSSWKWIDLTFDQFSKEVSRAIRLQYIDSESAR